MIRLLAILGVLLPVWQFATGAELPRPTKHNESNSATATGDPKLICETTLKEIVQGNPESAFEVFGKHVLVPTSEDADIKIRTFCRALHAAQERSAPIGYELVSEKKINNTLRKYQYLVKYERHVMRWEFVLYRPRNEWKALGVTFDHNIDSLYR